MRPCLALALTAALGLGPALGGCTPFPDLDATVTDAARDAPYPDLVPLDGLQARIAETRIAPETVGDTETRIARLKARAARLRGTVIDSGTRQRMKDGIAQ